MFTPRAYINLCRAEKPVESGQSQRLPNKNKKRSFETGSLFDSEVKNLVHFTGISVFGGELHLYNNTMCYFSGSILSVPLPGYPPPTPTSCSACFELGTVTKSLVPVSMHVC